MISNIFRARKPIFLANFYFLASNHLARVLLLRLYFPANPKLEERAIKNIGFPIRSDEFVQRTLLIIERKDRASKLERERERRGEVSFLRFVPFLGPNFPPRLIYRVTNGLPRQLYSRVAVTPLASLTARPPTRFIFRERERGGNVRVIGPRR